MKTNICYFSLLFLILLSCKETEEPILETPLEQFKRFEHPMFNYGFSDVQRLKVIGERMFYAHKTNPGYLTIDEDIVQLCCARNNNMDFRQVLSEKYIVAVDGSLQTFNVYDVENSRTGFIPFQNLISYETSARVNGGLNLFSTARNFEVNGNHLIASLIVDGQRKIYIFDLTRHVNFVGLVDQEGVIEVDFPNNPSVNGVELIKIDAFEDVWITSAFNFSQDFNGTYLIQKNGTNQRLFNQENFIYQGHKFGNNGYLFVGVDRNILVSYSGTLDDFDFEITGNNNLRFRIIQDRLVVWQPSFAGLIEVSGYDPETLEIKARILNNQGIEFSRINDIDEFNGKVYISTTQGLFTKSLESFWDSLPEEDLDQASMEFLNQFDLN